MNYSRYNSKKKKTYQQSLKLKFRSAGIHIKGETRICGQKNGKM
jgi:hypothetical protein